MEFHISRRMRDKCNFNLSLFSTNGNVIFSNFGNVRKFATILNDVVNPKKDTTKFIAAGQLNAMGLIDEVFHIICQKFRETRNETAFTDLLSFLENEIGAKELESVLLDFTKEFPPLTVYNNEQTEYDYLQNSTDGISNKVSTLEELMLLILANENPAFKPFYILYDDAVLKQNKDFKKTWTQIKEFFLNKPTIGNKENTLINFLKEPVIASPYSLRGQIEYLSKHWTELVGQDVLKLLSGIDMIAEEEKAGWASLSGPNGGDLPPMEAYNYESLMNEYEHFTSDKDWMGNVVLMAKTVLVWLDQLSKQYKTEITRLDQIPDEELDLLQSQGFTSLWLIGIWERSWGSKRIKQINGNPEAASSAYSLHDYEIAENIGGWGALENLRARLWKRGIRIAADMVPNHTALDSNWVTEKPHLFVQRRDCPFPSYSFNGENLSLDPRVSVYLEDNYYNKTDCAVVYKRVDNYTGDTRYIYHGNDGTGLPWNDTAQIDFLNPEAREEVIQKILHVARNFSVIRFDAAMVLAKKHIRRLWYPQHGHGGDIASRSENALSTHDFEAAIPNEFWREVVDRIAVEVPDTLLLAEAFWMMEGYFVRTLGMHRVYNSAFMNMLKKEENYKYRETIKNTINFDPQILKRFVNFMNNPDEETAVAQFGKGDKYFGVCTLMVTMPGLPMFGHGQIEGFGEKYGMEYTKAYWDEDKDWGLIDHHNKVIFPLMKKRYVFSDSENFRFYDVWAGNSVNENVFAYSNFCGQEKGVVFYNNAYNKTAGWVTNSCPYATKNENGDLQLHTQHIASSLGLTNKDNCFLIFKEVNSGLMYIRSSKEMYEKGMFLSLNEYEYQVLMDITEVEDDSTGKYALLNHMLNGRGVKDIEREVSELYLKDLYEKFSIFVTTAVFAPLEKKKTTTSKFLEEAKESAFEFFAILEEYLNEEAGAKQILSSNKALICDKETLWKNFSTRLTKVFTFKSRNISIELLVSYCVLLIIYDTLKKTHTVATCKDIIHTWSLDRKLCEIFSKSEEEEKANVIILKSMLEMIEISEAKVVKKDMHEFFITFITDFIKSKEGVNALSINKFDDVLWYNKESAEKLLETGITVYSVFKATKADLKSIEKIRELAIAAIDKSEYKIEKLVEILERM